MSLTSNIDVSIINDWQIKSIDDTDINDVIKEKGKLDYSRSFDITDIFYQERLLIAGESSLYDFSDVNQLLISDVVSKSFTSFKTLTIKNLGPEPLASLDINVTGGGYMGAFLGDPASLVPVEAGGILHYSTPRTGAVGLLGLENNSIYPLSYQIILGG
jgi:hypothetical protein